MNKLEQKLLDRLYEHEYEEIPNSALYKFNYEEAAKEMAELFGEEAVQFAEWLTKISYTPYLDIKPNLWVGIYGEQKTTQELFEIFIEKHYE